jgi:SAM-dependent methyltransferase
MGIDFSGVGTNVASKRRAPETNFCVSLAENPALKSGYFDLVYSFDSFIHIYDKVSLIKECFRLLKPGGKLIFSDWVDNKSVPKKIQSRGELWGPIHLISQAKYKQLLTRSGFKLIKLSDNSDNFCRTIARWEKVNLDYADHLIKKCGTGYFSKAKKRWQLARELSQPKKLSQVIFICRKPAKV